MNDLNMLEIYLGMFSEKKNFGWWVTSLSFRYLLFYHKQILEYGRNNKVWESDSEELSHVINLFNEELK